MRTQKQTIPPDEGLDVSTPCRVVNRTGRPIEVVIMAEQPTIKPTGVVPHKVGGFAQEPQASVELCSDDTNPEPPSA